MEWQTEDDEGLASHVRVYLDPDGWAECECGETFAAGPARWSAWERWCDHALDAHAKASA